jgi:hypothetical protein
VPNIFFNNINNLQRMVIIFMQNLHEALLGALLNPCKNCMNHDLNKEKSINK